MFSAPTRRRLVGGLVALGLSLWLAPAAAAETAGYHHLGAVSSSEWTGVVGRLQVRDPAVRAGTYDFVATRLMVKQTLPGGDVAWAEAGWSENGWRSHQGQVVYTYDSEADEWVFHERYPIADGDRIWIHLESAAGSGSMSGSVEWTAWLWWDGQWRELATVSLPGGGRAQIEEVVEVHVDEAAGARAFAVPEIEVDNVRLRDSGGALTPWRGEVDTAMAGGQGRYCVNWRQRYDTWSAGDC